MWVTYNSIIKQIVVFEFITVEQLHKRCISIIYYNIYITQHTYSKLFCWVTCVWKHGLYSITCVYRVWTVSRCNWPIFLRAPVIPKQLNLFYIQVWSCVFSSEIYSSMSISTGDLLFFLFKYPSALMNWLYGCS